MYLDDVLVRDGSGSLHLAREALSRRGAPRQFRRHELDRHGPAQRGFETLQHDSHAAAADHLLHLVLAERSQTAAAPRAKERKIPLRYRRRDRRTHLTQSSQGLGQRGIVGYGGGIADPPAYSL